MAGSKSNYLSKKLLDEPLGATDYAAPATVYIGLATAAIDDTTTGSTVTEAAYTSYARVAVTNNSTNWPAATGTTTATKSSGAAFTFPASTGGSATVTYAFIADSATLGNILYWFTVTSTAIASGDTPKFNSGGITVTED